MESSEFVYWDHSYNVILLVNLAIAIAIFTSLRFFSGVISHINPSNELIEKDNPAFGISLAGVVFGVTIVLTGAIYGDPIYTLQDSVVAVGLYGVIGIVLMAVTRLLFDKISMPKISIREEIVKGNVAAAIVDAGNVIATAIVIRTMMVWIETKTLEGIAAVLTGYVISQILLTCTTLIRVKRLNMKDNIDSLESEVKKGNAAISLRFAGRKIGSAFAISAASSVLVFETYNIQVILGVWALVSVVMITILSVLSFIANKVILARINVEDEVIRQRNTALGIVQCIIYISLGLLLSELMS